MAFTYQDVVDLARVPLNDEDKARYADPTLLLLVNHAILTLANRRPDLFIGQFSSLPDGEADLSDTFPLPAAYSMTLADYVTARAEMIDDEHANSGRAAAFMQLLNAEIPS
jgi:hypothetical protein